MDYQHKNIFFKLTPHYIAHYFIFRITRLALSLGIKFKSPLLIAVSLRYSLYRAPSILVNKKSKNKLIILHKMGGFEDIEQTYIKNNADFDILFLRRESLKLISRLFFTSNVGDINYLVVTNKNDRESYTKFLIKIFSYLNKMIKIKAILQFNLVYYAERELDKVCRSIDVKFITLQKEGVRPDISWEKTVEVYKKQFEFYHGHKVLTYNDDTRKCLIDSGNFDQDSIIEIGMPRLDYAHKYRSKKDSQNNRGITYFLIDRVAGLSNHVDENGNITSMRYVDKDGKVLYWDELIRTVNNAILDFAFNHKELNFFFKGKGKYVAYKDQFNNNFPANVKIVEGATGHKLLNKSSVIISFNSTIIFEALAAGIPVIVPMIFSSEPVEMRKHVLDLNKAVYYAHSVEELEDLIIKLHTSKPSAFLSSESMQVLNRYMGNSDGKSSKRLRHFLNRLMIE